MRTTFLAGVLAFVSPSVAGQQVFVVSTTPGPGVFSDKVSVAAAAAADGDFILVKSATIAPTILDGKSLTIVNDGPFATVGIGFLEIRNLADAQSVTLRGLGATIRVVDCAGSIWIEGSTIAGTQNSGGFMASTSPGLSVSNSATVTIVRSTLKGANGYDLLAGPTSGAPGRSALETFLGSSVYAMDSTFTGGNGTTIFASPLGADAVMVLNGGTFFSSKCTLTAGFSTGTFTVGGDALQVDGPAYLLETTLNPGQGGTAGPAGQPVNGVATFLPGTARHALATSPVREGQTSTWTFGGAPGELVGVIGSPAAGMGFMLPVFLGSLNVGFEGAAFVFLGSADATGSLSLQIPFGNLPATAQGGSLVMQALYFDLASGAIQIGPGSAIAIVDSTL